MLIEFEIIPVAVAFGLALFYFFVEYINSFKHFKLHTSWIAGISLAYFFFVLLPETSDKLPAFSGVFEAFELIFVLLGFSFMHIYEKFLIQKVEIKSQDKIRESLKMEKNLELVEDNLEGIIDREIINDTMDRDALKELAQTMISLRNEGKKLNTQILEQKAIIAKHVNKDLNKFHFYVNFFYHVLVGIILTQILEVNILSGLLFFIFAFSMAIIMRTDEGNVIFTDLNIKYAPHETSERNLLLALSVMIGVSIISIIEICVAIPDTILFSLLSFISGLVLYIIIREILPKNEKGKPIYFICGMIGFSLVILLIRYIEHSFSH